MKNTKIFNHITAFIIAIILSFAIIQVLLKPEPTPKAIIPSKHESYYASFENNNFAKEDFINAINSNQIVMLGSSELTNQSFPNISNRFFNEQLGIQFLSIGHAGNQSFNYACEIASLKQKKSSQAKVVFIISPGWFLGESANGTSTTSFLEFINNDMLNNIIFNDSISEQFKTAVFNYVGRHYDNINFPSPTHKYIYYKQKQSSGLLNKLRYSFMVFVYQRWIEKTITKPPLPSTKGVLKERDASKIEQLNWDSIITNAKQAEKQKCTNEFAVNDAYYNEYAKDKIPRETDPIIKPNQELADLIELVQICKEENVDAFFILQGLNPYAYSNLQEINPIIDQVKKVIRGGGFTLFDMWQPDKNKYQKGTLTDVMHTGEYGWALINQEIYKHYIKRNK